MTYARGVMLKNPLQVILVLSILKNLAKSQSGHAENPFADQM
jgi:hypothetical protein